MSKKNVHIFFFECPYLNLKYFSANKKSTNHHLSFSELSFFAVVTKITAHHNKYNNTWKVCNTVRISKMLHRQKVIEHCWRDGTGRLDWCKVATDLQLLKMLYLRIAVEWGSRLVSLYPGYTLYKVVSLLSPVGDTPYFEAPEKLSCS